MSSGLRNEGTCLVRTAGGGAELCSLFTALLSFTFCVIVSSSPQYKLSISCNKSITIIILNMNKRRGLFSLIESDHYVPVHNTCSASNLLGQIFHPKNFTTECEQ